MTKPITIRAVQPASSRQILARVLDTPDLATAVQALPAATLVELVDAVGLEDAGELVAFASPMQLAEMFDADLWRSERAGGDERFDGDRFLVWLTVMMEAGDGFVAARLAGLPEDLVTLALHAHLHVLDMDALLVDLRELDAGEAMAVDKLLSNQLSEELDRYRLVSRRHDGWDTVLAAVVALDRDHHAVLARILERLCAATAEDADRDGGLCSVLSAAEMLASDTDAERKDRRAARGFVAPADARAFLKLASQPVDTLPVERDAITRAYFRGLDRQRPVLGGARTGAAAPTEPSALASVLVEAGVIARATTGLLGSGDVPREALLVGAMRGLAERDAAAFASRSEELVYLANVLVAGAALDGRRYRPAEAVQRVIETCSRGLELAARGADVVELLRCHPADALFRLGWNADALARTPG